MAGSDVTVEILKDIRDEIRGVRTEVRDVRTEVRDLRTDTNLRFTVVEATLLDLAEQQRFIVRYTKAISERGFQLEPRVSDLETRVDKLESK